MLSFGTDTALQSFCHSFIALPMIRHSKSAQKSAAQVCQVATVVMATTQLVLSQFKNVLCCQLKIERQTLNAHLSSLLLPIPLMHFYQKNLWIFLYILISYAENHPKSHLCTFTNQPTICSGKLFQSTLHWYLTVLFLNEVLGAKICKSFCALVL